MKNVPLEKMVLAASPKFPSQAGKRLPEIKVFRLGDRDAKDYDFTWGACEALWAEIPEHRLGILYQLLWHLVVVHRYEPTLVDRALQAVPEYRSLQL